MFALQRSVPYFCFSFQFWSPGEREVNYFNENLTYYMIRDPMVLYGDNDTATARAKERKTTMNDRHSALKYHGG